MRIVLRSLQESRERKRDYRKSTFAYFTESKNLSDVDTLATIAEASGLDKQEAFKCY